MADQMTDRARDTNEVIGSDPVSASTKKSIESRG